MIAVDTNVLLRYLLQPIDSRNPPWQTEKAIQVIHSAECVFLSDIVLAETEWVMENVFDLNKKAIHSTLYELACHPGFQFEDWEALHCALMDYKEYPKVDFSDCPIARRVKNKGAVTLYSFENKKKPGALPVATSLSVEH